jgi:arylsulfatase A-like enzyme
MYFNNNMQKTHFISVIGLILLSSCLTKKIQSIKDASPTKLNILLIVADDMGYTDLGCFGSEISTPNIDALASEGVTFTNFYTAPMCAPCRASILTGANNHLAGVGCQFHRVDSIWGYEGYLTNRVKTIPESLKEANYHSFISGKWHLGKKEDQWPFERGFDETFVTLGGAANHHNNLGFTSKGSFYAHNGDSVDWPIEGYSTELYTDYALEFMTKEDSSDSPFFGYMAYTAPHWPLQVDKSYWKKYEIIYKNGYEVLRKERLQNLKKLGYIDANYKLPESHPTVIPWDTLDTFQRSKEIRKMALYAGMLENLDFHIGRLIKHLKETGEYDNTVIIFMSDNGSSAKDFYNNPGWEYVKETYNNDFENMGSPTSFVSYGPGWAEASSAPHRYHKRYVYEGGIRAPLIIKPSKSIQIRNKVNKSFVAMTDLAETCYELAGIKNPNNINPELAESLPGTSILPTLQGRVKEIHNNDETWVLEHNHHVLVRRGKWKLVNPGFEWKEENFVLYNLISDPTESTDIKIDNPEVFQELLAEWHAFKQKYKVIRIDE